MVAWVPNGLTKILRGRGNTIRKEVVNGAVGSFGAQPGGKGRKHELKEMLPMEQGR
jgi:hypothetical protein